MVKRLLLAALAMLFTYAIAEAALTSLYAWGQLDPITLWMHERTDPKGNIRFDPIRGSWLSSTPARIVGIASNGVIETMGIYVGNNHGFPDGSNFYQQKLPLTRKRFVVFGDSFTHAQFLEANWTKRVEERSADEASVLQLMNLSLDGSGLGNWANVLEHYVVPGEFELDGVIFAVWGTDLLRTFTWWDDSPSETGPEPADVLWGRMKHWRLAARPRSSVSAQLDPVDNWWVVTTEQFELALAGSWRPEFHRPLRPPFIQMRAKRLWNRMHKESERTGRADPMGKESFRPEPMRVIDSIRRALEELDLPVMVVQIPNRPPMKEVAWQAPEFAKLLGGHFVDGTEAYEGMSDSEWRECWLPYDPHWSQKGSDHFADFMARKLESWPNR